ncbi:hypothetical protein [Actinomyces faecalis]|uniref:hypothetical protein n=1 Tax=Actinomyces faecalis TaxID=2722820 RepID=UPI0015533253|nr:hypothetical protein [Actinomyces faecalis]
MTTRKKPARRKTPRPAPRLRPPATEHTCPRCLARVLTGWDDDLMASRHTVDAAPVTALGELQAWEAGLACLELAGQRLSWRDSQAVTARPAWTVSVHPTHRCHLHLERAPRPRATQTTSWPGHLDQPPY